MLLVTAVIFSFEEHKGHGKKLAASEVLSSPCIILNKEQNQYT
jgi:hypothetical protein